MKSLCFQGVSCKQPFKYALTISVTPQSLEENKRKLSIDAFPNLTICTFLHVRNSCFSHSLQNMGWSYSSQHSPISQYAPAIIVRPERTLISITVIPTLQPSYQSSELHMSFGFTRHNFQQYFSSWVFWNVFVFFLNCRVSFVLWSMHHIPTLMALSSKLCHIVYFCHRFSQTEQHTAQKNK